MILRFFNHAIEYPVPDTITEGHPLWDNYWRCGLVTFLFIKFLHWHWEYYKKINLEDL